VVGFLEQSIANGDVRRAEVHPNRAILFLSSWWQIQDPAWIPFLRPARKVLLRDGLLELENDRVEAYGPYVELMQELAGALEIDLEDLEGLCVWLHERSAEPVSSDGQGKDDDSEPAPAGPRVWLIAPGRRASAWEAHYAAGVVAIGWDRLGDLREYRSVDEVNAKLRALRDDGRNPFNVAHACFNFAHRMKPGDIVFAKRGRYEIIGAGVVMGEYEHAPHPASKDDPFVNRRRVRWIHKGSGRPRDKALVMKTLTEITAHTGLVRACAEVFDTTIEDIADAAGRSMPQGVDNKGTESAKEPEPYTREHALAELFLDEEDLDDMLALLRGRRNVVLQGPPGTGKTFLAACLARLLIGSRSEKQVCRVQFHQSMTYEDFVQGYRPDGTGFTLRTGPFLRFCNEALQDTENDYVLIIDEINRGNLSRILGELMLLIEHDKRKPEWAVTLAYAGADDEPTWVPPNLHIIGTMNTADRSLALVDYALRRRFAFIDVESAVSHPRFRAHLQARGVDDSVLAWIVKRIPELNRRIRDDANLGRGFVIGHSYFCGGGTDERWYERVIRHEIVPLLHEYWFDARAQVEDSEAKLLDVD
jgi:5-methylcytosine-specific restriction protein B